LGDISSNLVSQNLLSKAERIRLLSLDLTTLIDDELLFKIRLNHFDDLSRIGRWADSEAIWRLLDPMGRGWTRESYRPGDAEFFYARFQFRKGDPQEEHLAAAERLATEGKNRSSVRDLHNLRGKWQMEQGQWSLAAESLHEAVRMARGVNMIDATAETYLALARFHLGQLTDPRREAEEFTQARKPDYQALAELWLAIGDREQAKKYAFAAYKRAWADGEPYVWLYELNKATALLEQLGTEIPRLPPYEPAKDEEFPWEDKVAAAIETLRAEQ
jgi:tetratricopeptide (TPR) repeat protein